MKKALKQGIYILAVPSVPANIDAMGPNYVPEPLLPIKVTIGTGHGTCSLVGAFKYSVDDQFKVVLGLLKDKVFPNATHVLKNLDIEVDIGDKPYDGSSLGLPVLLALVDAITALDVPCRVGATGHFDAEGNLKKVDLIQEKLIIAFQNNIPIVIAPKENKEDIVKILKKNKDLNIIKIICVSNILDALTALWQLNKYGIVDGILH